MGREAELGREHDARRGAERTTSTTESGDGCWTHSLPALPARGAEVAVGSLAWAGGDVKGKRVERGADPVGTEPRPGGMTSTIGMGGVGTASGGGLPGVRGRLPRPSGLSSPLGCGLPIVTGSSLDAPAMAGAAGFSASLREALRSRAALVRERLRMATRLCCPF